MMRVLPLIAGACAALASPAAAAQAVSPTPAAPVPAAPAPADPATRAAADAAVSALVPKGIYRRMMREQFPAMMDAMMAEIAALKPSDLGLPPGKDGDKTLGEGPLLSDPATLDKMRTTSKEMADAMGPVFDVIEPRVRVGMARAFARRFTLAQLTEMNAFFATPAGRAFSSSYMLTYMDPEVIREMFAGLPEMMKALPAVMAKMPIPPVPTAKP